jgi:PKD repeat protein
VNIDSTGKTEVLKWKICTVAFLLAVFLFAGSGCVDITDRAEVTAEFTVDSQSGGTSTVFQFTDMSKWVVTSWQWDFDNDGTVDSTAQNPTHTYSLPGIYTVSLLISGLHSVDAEIKLDYIGVYEEPLTITTILPDGHTNKNYSQQMAAKGGVGARTWEITAGALPAGLPMNSSGLISGTATANGTYDFTVRCEDSYGSEATRDYTVTVQRGWTSMYPR